MKLLILGMLLFGLSGCITLQKKKKKSAGPDGRTMIVEPGKGYMKCFQGGEVVLTKLVDLKTVNAAENGGFVNQDIEAQQTQFLSMPCYVIINHSVLELDVDTMEKMLRN